MKKQKIIKTIIIIFFICLLPFFILPYFNNYVVNFGSIMGLCFCFVGILCTVFSSKIAKLIKKIAKSKGGKVFIISLFSIILAFSLGFGATYVYIWAGGHTTAENQETLIVLGCFVRPDKSPSAMLSWRIDAAEKYLKENPNSVAVLCGGKGDREPISEAECMKNVLVERGIDSSRLFLEQNSMNTIQNIKFAKLVIEENNLSKNVAVVTNAFHVSRGRYIAEQIGLNAEKVAAYDDRAPVSYFREIASLWYLWLGQIVGYVNL